MSASPYFETARVEFICASDYRLNDFPGWDNFDWNIKREHVAKAREIAQGKVKIVATYTGLFLEIAIAVSPFGIEAATFVSFRADFSLIVCFCFVPQPLSVVLNYCGSRIRHRKPHVYVRGFAQATDRNDVQGRHRARTC